MSKPDWLEKIPVWLKMLGLVAVGAFAVFSSGWTARATFGAQLDLPVEVKGIQRDMTSVRATVDTLKDRMKNIEEIVGQVLRNSARLDTLGLQMDAVYCVQEAQMMERNPKTCLFLFRRAGGSGD